MPGQEIAKSLGGDDETVLTVGSLRALAEPSAQGGVGRVEQLAEQFAFALEKRAEETGDRQNHAAMRHRLADLLGDDRSEGEGAPLGARSADHTLLTGKGVKEFVRTVLATPTGETSAEVPAALKSMHGGRDRPGTLRMGCFMVGPVSIKDLPNGGGTRVAGAIATGDRHNSISRRRSGERRWDEAYGVLFKESHPPRPALTGGTGSTRSAVGWVPTPRRTIWRSSVPGGLWGADQWGHVVTLSAFLSRHRLVLTYARRFHLGRMTQIMG